MFLGNFFKFSFKFSFFISLLFLISCSDKNNFLKEVSLSSLNDLGSISSLQGNFSQNDSEQREEEENPELRFSFQMMSADPKAVLPADQMVRVGALVEIDGAMSENAVSYRWSFDVFPENSNAVINDQTTSAISFRPDVEGLYLVKLVVRDADTNSKASYLAIRATTENIPPNFRISTISSRSEGFTKHVRIRLRGIQDDDEVSLVRVDYGDGNETVYYGWEINSISGNINHYYLKGGDYKVVVTMIDNEGASTTKSKMINIKDNKLPVLKYSVNSASGVAPFTLRVDASASFDPDGNNPLHFYWDWGNGESAYGTDTVYTYTYTEPGVYKVEPFLRNEISESNGLRTETYNEFLVYVDDPDNPGTHQAPAGGSHPVLNLNAPASFTGKAPLTVNFDASQSFDLEGDDFEVHWDFDGFTFRKYEKGLRVTKTYDNPGFYNVRVTIRDSHGNEFRKWYNILVYDSLVEEQPRFFASQDDNDLKNFHFSAGTNQLYGVPVDRFFWDLGNGEVRRGLYTYTYSEDDNYIVSLSTIDMFGKRQTVNKFLRVDNQKHSINAELDPFYELAQVGQDIYYTAEKSSSGISNILNFFWYMTTGFREALSISYSYAKKGVYTNDLRVTDSTGISQSAYNWTVVNSGEGPKAIAKLSTYIGTVPLTVSFDGSNSTSPGTITDYDWHIADHNDTEKSFQQSTASYTFEDSGEKYQELIVKDSNGNFDVNFQQVTVLDPDDVNPNNQAPTVQINANQIVINDLAVNMNATFNDSDGRIRYTEWDWGDGVVDVFRQHEDSPSHSYENYGSYTITVRVFDDMGAITTASHDITLVRSQQAPPRAQRSAPIEKEEEQSKRVYLPTHQFSNRDRLQQEEREKEGCYKKQDGQMLCYASRDRGGL